DAERDEQPTRDAGHARRGAAGEGDERCDNAECEQCGAGIEDRLHVRHHLHHHVEHHLLHRLVSSHAVDLFGFSKLSGHAATYAGSCPATVNVTTRSRISAAPRRSILEKPRAGQPRLTLLAARGRSYFTRVKSP